MKKKKITYGVYGLIEWHTQLSLGKARVKASFTGGSLTTQGIVPATLMTDDPVVQMAIEKSLAYRTGKIRKVRERQTNEDISVERNLPKPITVSVSQEMKGASEEDVETNMSASLGEVAAAEISPSRRDADPASASQEDAAPAEMSPSQEDAAAEMSPSRRDAAPADVSPSLGEATTEISPTQGEAAAEMSTSQRDAAPSEEDKNSMEPMVFNCNDDAKDFFEEKYGVVRNKMRTRADIMNVARSLGVNIMFA